MNNPQATDASPAISLKLIAVLVGLAFAIALAVVIGKQMSTQAMAVVIGIVCGVAASIPTTALLVICMIRRERQRQDETQALSRPGAYPPVVVIQGGSPNALPFGLQSGYWPTPAPPPAANRQFHLIGGDELLVEK